MRIEFSRFTVVRLHSQPRMHRIAVHYFEVNDELHKELTLYHEEHYIRAVGVLRYLNRPAQESVLKQAIRQKLA